MDSRRQVNQGGEGHAGRSGTSYTNNYPIAFSTVVESCIAVHIGAVQDVNVVVEPYWASYFMARGSYIQDDVGIVYIAIGW